MGCIPFGGVVLGVGDGGGTYVGFSAMTVESGISGDLCDGIECSRADAVPVNVCCSIGGVVTGDGGAYEEPSMDGSVCGCDIGGIFVIER